MKLDPIYKLALLIFVVPILMTGCFTLSSGDDSNGSLSDAMEHASDDYEGDRTVTPQRGNRFSSEDSHDDKINNSRANSSSANEECVENRGSRNRAVNPSTTFPELNLQYASATPPDSTDSTQAEVDPLGKIEFNIARHDSLMIEKIKQEELEAKYEVKVTKSGEEKLILIPEPPERYDLSFTLQSSRGQLFNSKFEGYSEFGIGFRSFLTNKRTINGSFSVGFTKVNKDRKIYNSVKPDVEIVNLEFSTSYFMGKKHTFANPFYKLGAGYTFKFWNYRNPIIVEGEDDPIEKDRVSGMTLYAGVGVLLFQTNKHNLEIQLTPGCKFWHDMTGHDFENDVFKSYSFLKLGLVLGFGIK